MIWDYGMRDRAFVRNFCAKSQGVFLMLSHYSRKGAKFAKEKNSFFITLRPCGFVRDVSGAGLSEIGGSEMNKAIKMIFLVLFVFLLPLTCFADDFDGSKPLICAVIEDFDCIPGDECLSGTAESINIPQFLRIDFKEKTITGTRQSGEVRSVEIGRMERVDGKVIFQGIQDGKAWSMVITEATGKMTITAADDQVGFVVFGACTTP